MNVLDLFSGIGGFSLGLERAGMRTVAFCEIKPFCRSILRGHWPRIPCYEDIRTFAEDYSADSECGVDVICGGFPCQDISRAGKRAGIAGPRSGLWRAMVRAIRLVRPRFAIVENVAALLGDGMGRVLGDLAENGFDAEWDCIQARQVGLPHARERVWIVAHRDGLRKLQPGWGITDERGWTGDESKAIDWILSRGGILRGANGFPAGMDRVGPLGNAVVPQIPEIIGRAIMQDMIIHRRSLGGKWPDISLL